MTPIEFAKGWMLLTTQPWGRTYRIDIPAIGDDPNPGDIQSELYYQSVKRYDGAIWIQACHTYAKGERWPSVDQLTTTMDLCRSSHLKLTHSTPNGVSLEDALKERPDLLAVVKRVLA